jgi:hypothetical protein
MPRIEKPRGYRVSLTEYERGWGQKPWDDVYFDNEAEARQYVIDFNLKHNNKDYVPDWYVRAEYCGAI